VKGVLTGEPGAPPASAPSQQEARRARLRAEFPLDTTEDTEKRAKQEEEADLRRIDEAGCGLAGLLLYRMGLKTVEELIADQGRRNRSEAESVIDLTPPITAEKITNALAAVTARIATGELEPKKGTAMLYAIQNLTAAHHAQIEQQKWEARQRREEHALSGAEERTPNAEATPLPQIHGRSQALLPEMRQEHAASGKRRADRALSGMRETPGRKAKADRNTKGRAAKPRARRRTP
jgi:hypothetical protein